MLEHYNCDWMTKLNAQNKAKGTKIFLTASEHESSKAGCFPSTLPFQEHPESRLDIGQTVETAALNALK